eukprot:scaffold3808_cov112-Isochrysis_galbana.AAC.48
MASSVCPISLRALPSWARARRPGGTCRPPGGGCEARGIGRPGWRAASRAVGGGQCSAAEPPQPPPASRPASARCPGCTRRRRTTGPAARPRGSMRGRWADRESPAGDGEHRPPPARSGGFEGCGRDGGGLGRGRWLARGQHETQGSCTPPTPRGMPTLAISCTPSRGCWTSTAAGVGVGSGVRRRSSHLQHAAKMVPRPGMRRPHSDRAGEAPLGCLKIGGGVQQRAQLAPRVQVCRIELHHHTVSRHRSGRVSASRERRRELDVRARRCGVQLYRAQAGPERAVDVADDAERVGKRPTYLGRPVVQLERVQVVLGACARIARLNAARFEQQQHICAAWMLAKQVHIDSACLLVALRLE